MTEGEELVDADRTETPATDADDDDAAWPVLSELDLQVCLTDSAIPGIPTGGSPSPDRPDVTAS